MAISNAESLQLKGRIAELVEAVAKDLNMIKERDDILSYQKTRMEDLEQISLSGGLQQDDRYIFRSESDSMVEAMRLAMG